jgi:hypothetical protein
MKIRSIFLRNDPFFCFGGQVLRLLSTVLSLDDAQRRRLETGAHRLVRSGGSGGGGGGILGIGRLFQAPVRGWEALTEADIGEQASSSGAFKLAVFVCRLCDFDHAVICLFHSFIGLNRIQVAILAEISHLWLSLGCWTVDVNCFGRLFTKFHSPFCLLC